MSIFTGIQPSGIITLGNYIGSIKNFKKTNNEKIESFFCIVDQHSHTIVKDAEQMKESIKSLAALYIAMDLHKETNIFIQSQVPGHSQLAWVLMCFAKNGELERITQYKDKSQKNISVSAGLFTYPVLMAADILLYDTTQVPVGEDQKQHIELTRDLAERFNSFYKKDIFVIPEPVISKVDAKIYSLVDPTKKMSKSDENPKSMISMLDDEKQILKKVKSATTDSVGVINYDIENQPGISNLLTIYSSLKGVSMEDTLMNFKEKSYGELKIEVANVIIDELKPIQEKYYEIISDENFIEIYLKDSTKKAQEKATQKIKEVYEAIGFIV